MGKKAKGLANKLAKMSDEERARYLQHRADVEEEAKRRKEQLIATFMKNKIKKEDAFSRLNLAKINQNWHQILRKAKNKEMKENVAQLKNWIERILSLKNRTIQKLVEELDDAEEQYCNNFQAHFSHIDRTLQNHDLHLQELKSDYGKELSLLLENSETERNNFLENSETEIEQLKTLIFAQEIRTTKTVKRNRENYISKRNDLWSTCRIQLEAMQKGREDELGKLWKQTSTVIKNYVQQTDKRRLHFAELKRLDAESAVEIAKNQEVLDRDETQIDRLKTHLAKISAENEQTTKRLKDDIKKAAKEALVSKQNLHSNITRDEKQLRKLAKESNKVLDQLEKLQRKGENLLVLMQTCRKFETEREKVTRWEPICDLSSTEESEEESSTSETTGPERRVKSTPKIRPKTSKKRPNTISVIDLKTSKQRKQKTIFDHKPPRTEFPEEGFESLECLEGLWWLFNKVEVNCMEIKEQKKTLLEENRRLKAMLRGILEASALGKTIPDSKTSSGVTNKSRFVVSAPPRCLV